MYLIKTIKGDITKATENLAYQAGYTFNLCENDTSIVILNQNIKNQ